MTTKEIKKNWATRLEKIRKMYGQDGGLQMRIPPTEMLAVLTEAVPEGFEDIHKSLQENSHVTHVLLRPAQVDELINYVAPRERAPNSPADVPGQP